MKLASRAMKYARESAILGRFTPVRRFVGDPLGPYKTSNLKFLAKLGICKYIHVLAGRNIAFSCNIAASAVKNHQTSPVALPTATNSSGCSFQFARL